MYTEIIKIIEGGLSNDKEKIINYANVFANNLENQGELSLAKKIRNVISKKKGGLTSLDSFSTKPVDSESRMDIVEITMPNVILDDVVLSKYAQETVYNFVESYTHRDLLLKSGIDSLNTLLLYGSPGCGKTTVAQCISTITGLPLVTAKLDGLVSSLLGSTAKNIRKIFEYASKRECILFLDEFDVIAKLRDDKNELGELKRVVNSLIQNIDSFSNNSIIIAATNHHELLDPAIWRRFSTILELEKPNQCEISKLIKILLRDKETSFCLNNKKFDALSKAMIGLSHSDIKTILFSALRNGILFKKNVLNYCDVLKEIYFHKNHMIENEEDFIGFLIINGATHEEINSEFGFSLRKIRTISKNIDREDV